MGVWAFLVSVVVVVVVGAPGFAPSFLRAVFAVADEVPAVLAGDVLTVSQVLVVLVAEVARDEIIAGLRLADVGLFLRVASGISLSFPCSRHQFAVSAMRRFVLSPGHIQNPGCI